MLCPPRPPQPLPHTLTLSANLFILRLTLVLLAGIRLHAHSRDVNSFNRLKRMLEDPSSIPLPGSPYGPMGTMAFFVSCNSCYTILGCLCWWLHRGAVNGAYRGHNYNSKTIFDGFAIAALTITRSRFQTQPILYHSTANWRNEDIGRCVEVRVRC